MTDSHMKMLPEFYSKQDYLVQASVLPEIPTEGALQTETERLMWLDDIFQLYMPTMMSVEIYNKLYFSTARALERKNTRQANMQRVENYKAASGLPFTAGVMGGADSFTVIGPSGIGKSSAIFHGIRMMEGTRIIQSDTPYCRITPCVNVQCPHDCSIKGLLLELLRQIDVCIGSDYYDRAMWRAVSVDMLVGMVSQAVLNHVGLLIIDEIQNVRFSKNGVKLVTFLTQLINTTGVPICMVGTPEVKPFFENKIQLARRSVGLEYGRLGFDTPFIGMCRQLSRYQYTSKRMELTDAALYWIYEHSAGLPSLAISLWHDAQEIAIVSGRDVMDMAALTEAYDRRMGMLQRYTLPPKQKSPLPAHPSIKPAGRTGKPGEVPLTDIVLEAKERGADILEFLRQYIPVEEVRV